MSTDNTASGAGGDQENLHNHHQHHHEWKLNVQNVVIEVPHPEIVVREALRLAGFDPNAGWIIVLKVHGEPKREVELSTIIDLRHHGIEKLRLTPRHINNGDAIARLRRDFALLQQDEVHLNRLGFIWEAILHAGRRWLVIRSYPLPSGYSAAQVDIAIDMPPTYPGAQLDMFYCNPHLRLASGAAVPQTQHTEMVAGVGFQRWSRHRQWDSSKDTLATHLALVDESLRREVEK